MKATAGAAAITAGYEYNPLDQVTGLSRNGVNQAKYIYDERGNLISIRYANGTGAYTAFEYDDANRLKSKRNYNKTGGLLESYVYNYDPNGNRTSVVTTGGTIWYQYDQLNRLTQETLLDGTTIAYEYDAGGNRTKKTQGAAVTTYTHDNANQLTAVNGQAYTYDPNGNLTNNGSRIFVYDAENQLIEVKNSSGVNIIGFAYDHKGRRTSATVGSDTYNFHYSGDKVIYETDASNNILIEYTWDAQGNPVTMGTGGKTYYYHLNGHGDVMALTDNSGNIAAQYQYDAWDRIISKSGSLADVNPYHYAGYRYDVNIERFLTRDTYYGNQARHNR